MTKDSKRPSTGLIIDMQQSSIRATRQAQGALHKGEWVDAIVHLETAHRYAGLCKDLQRDMEGLV